MAAQAANAPTPTPMSRREFLYYIWAASMAMVTAYSGAALVWFLYPRFKAGTFGGVFELDISEVPPPDAAPKAYPGGRFWLVNIGERLETNKTDEYPQTGQYPQTQGVKALYMICVHLGCLYQWRPTNDRFECPCHGSKYLATGTAIEGPATRNLDVFIIEAVDSQGQVISRTEARVGSLEGTAINVAGATRLRINTGARITGAERAV